MDSRPKFYLLMFIVSRCLGELTSDFDESITHIPNEILLEVPGTTADILRNFFAIMNNVPQFSIERSTSGPDTTLFLVKVAEFMGDSTLTYFIRTVFGNYLDYASYNYQIDALYGEFGGFTCNGSLAEESTCIAESTDFWGLARISQITSASRMLPSYRKYKYSDSNDGEGVLVYVVDSGVYDANEEFENVNVRHGYHTYRVRDEGFEDFHGHGTHVAGTIAGKTCGVAKKADIISVKVLNSKAKATAYDIVSAMHYIQRDYMEIFEQRGTPPKAVVNLSLGFTGDFKPLERAIRKGVDMGIIYVAAAGNDAIDACRVVPASSPDTITVGAIDPSDKLSSFSNYGSCVDILAPGKNIRSAAISKPSAFKELSGTSMAAPHVAGVIARVLSNVETSVVRSSIATCVKDHIKETAIAGHARSLKEGTPNLILYAGCNSCFGARDCTLSPSEDLGWTQYMAYSPDNEEGLTDSAEIMKFRFSKLFIFFVCFTLYLFIF